MSGMGGVVVVEMRLVVYKREEGFKAVSDLVHYSNYSYSALTMIKSRGHLPA